MTDASNRSRGVESRSGSGATIVVVLLLMLVTWIGVNAVWGLTGSDTMLSAPLGRVLSLGWWIVATLVVLALAASVAAVRGRPALAELVWMLAAYLAGVVVARYALVAFAPSTNVPLGGLGDAIGILGYRLFFLIPILPMLVVCRLLRPVRRGDYRLGVGDWSARFGASRGPRWSRLLLGWFAVVALFGLLLQASVGFRPLTSGRVLVFLLPLLLLALLNALAEETIFRGLIQPGAVACLGRGWGIAAQAVLFGVHHWGASPHYVGTIAAAVFTALLGALWGKSVLETRGLGWAVLTHASLDLVFFSAQFV